MRIFKLLCLIGLSSLTFCGGKDSYNNQAKTQALEIEEVQIDETALNESLKNIQTLPLDKFLEKALIPWAPKSIKVNKNTADIVLNQRMITDSIYYSILSSGICGKIWLKESSWLGDVKITILNEYSKQGWIFEGNALDCLVAGQYSDKKSRILLAGKSRLY
jgi:hypothetical protein